MVLLDRLEKFAGENAYFSNLQFGFQEGEGCLEASLAILESINHMLEKGNKLLHAFLMFAKPLTLFELTSSNKLSRSLVSKGGFGWLSKTFILKAQVLCEGVLSRKFSVSQGTRVVYRKGDRPPYCELLRSHCLSC